MAKIFLSPEERRLRAGWRLGAHSILLAVTLFGLGIPFSIILDTFPGIPILVIEAVFAGAAWSISIYLARRWFDKRTFGSLGVRWDSNSLWELLQGIGITAVMMTMIFVIEWAAGWIEIEAIGWNAGNGSYPGGIAVWSFFFLFVGWYEELYFRGYLFANLADGINRYWALGLSTILFSAGHLNNPNSSWASLIGILAAGYMLGYAYLRAENLWLPVGLHIGWNVFEGVVFGFPVSGMKTAAFVQQAPSGPEIMTGGHFGPEAGIILFPALLIGIWLVHTVTKNNTTQAFS